MSAENSAALKVLAVDDCEDNLDVLDALLSSESIEILVAPSAARALALLRIHDVALALLDVHMPDMDGYELAAAMRADPSTRQIPILFLTAGAVDRSAEFRSHDAGPVEFWLKPIDGAALRRKARECAQRHRRALAPDGQHV